MTTLKEGFYSLAHQLKLPTENYTLDEIVNSIYRHFSDHIETGLFIFDNAHQFNDSENGIYGYLPNALALKRRPLILITSRDTKWAISEKNIIKIEELTEDESVQLVTKTLSLSVAEQTDKNKRQIRKLAQSLQGFPLGLCLASSNINYSDKDDFEEEVKYYLKEMQAPAEGWIRDAQLEAMTKYKLVMNNVWDMTLEKIKKLNGGCDAIRLLNLMAFLPTDEITIEILSDIFNFIFEKPAKKKGYSILENKSMISLTKLPLSLTCSASTLKQVTQIKVHRLVQTTTREKLDAREDYFYLQYVCHYLSHKRLHDQEHYSTNAVLCAQEHLKTRNWPIDFIRYSVMFCSFMTFFENEIPESTFQIFKDVYEFLKVEHMTIEDLKTEENGINLFTLCVLWKNKINKEPVTIHSLFLADKKLGAENFKKAFLSLKSPSLEILLIPKMELNLLQRYLYNHCYQKLFRSTQMRWLRRIEVFPRKMRHAAVAVENQIFSSGGISSSYLSDSDSPMDIFVLNLDETEIKWKRIIPNSSSPSTSTFTPGKTYFHTTVSCRNSFIIFGGKDYKENELNSVCRFNVQTLQWDKLNVTGALPAARYLHSAVVIQNEMIIFGGLDSSGNQLNDVHSLNLDSFVWSKITTIKGTPPTSRWGHSVVAYNNRFIYIFGGHDGSYLNDVIGLDWNTKEWKRPETSGTIPHPRRFHSSFMHKGLMYIYGGQVEGSSFDNNLFSYNPETWEWREVKPIGEPPSSRIEFGCVALNNSAYILGGTENWREAVDDTFVLQLE